MPKSEKPKERRQPRDPFQEAGLLPLSRAALERHCDHRTLKRAVERGDLPAVRHGGSRIYVRPADLDAYFSGERPSA